MTHTEIVKEKLKGCLEIEHFSDWNADYRCSHFLEGKFYFCDKCKATLKGMQIAIESELEFLEEHLKFVRKARKSVAGLQPYQYPIQKRITDCKNALKLIEEGK